MTDAPLHRPLHLPLHVAIDSGPLHGHRTGVGVATAGMMTALRARDDVVVAPYLVSRRATVGPDEHRLPLPGIVASHLWSRGGFPRADRWLAGADVVHGTNYVAPPTALPTVVSVYDCWFLRHPELATPVVRRAGEVLRRAVGRGAWIHASSDATAGHVAELLGTERVRTILLGAPAVEMWEPTDVPPATLAGRLGDARVIACIATEERRKGVPLLVDAFAALAGDLPEVALVLAGAPGDDSEAIDRAIARAGAPTDGRIHRLGPIDEITKRWLLRRATVLAYPSVDEGFGFPVLEAHATGVPVVATAVGSIPEIAGDAARLSPHRDPIAFAGALEEVLIDDAVRRRLVTAGHANVERFRWTDTAEQLVALYRTAVEDAR